MNNNPKTLVILTPGFPANKSDENCLPMLQAFVRSVKKTHSTLNIVVLSFDYPYFKKRYEWFGVNVICFNGRNKGGLSKLLLWKTIGNTLNEINRTQKIIGLLIIWLDTCSWVGKRFAAKHKLKHFCWIMGQDARPGNKYVKRIKPRADELIALSDFLQEEFEKNYGIRPKHVIPAIIDEEKFTDPSGKKEIDLLAAGSLIPLKQFNLFIEIVFEIKMLMPGIKAVLAGGGTEERNLKNLSIQYQLGDTIEFTGEIPHRELLKLMQTTKVFLHPSSYEGFSGVCLEALYAGAYVISFSRAMNKEIEHWHIVSSVEEMIKKATEILKEAKPDQKRVMVFYPTDITGRMMELFGVKPDQ
jgi:glycosyltransferase involved in cell wall biosynthesis